MMYLSTIPIDDLQTMPEIFQIQTHPTNEAMGSLIHYPPLLVGRINEAHILLDGYQRLAFLKKHHASSIQGIVVPIESLQKGFLVKLEWEMGSSSYSYFTKAIVLERCIQQFSYSMDDIKNQIAPLLGIEPSIHRINDYLHILSLIPSLRAYCIEHNVPMTWAKRFGKWDTTCQQALYDWTQCLQFSLGELRRIFEWVDDLSLAQRVSPYDILTHADYRSILHHETWKPALKKTKLQNLMEQQRYPVLSAHQKRWDAACGASVPSHIKIEPPPYFEGNYIEVRIRLKTEKQIQQTQRWLELGGWDILKRLCSLSFGKTDGLPSQTIDDKGEEKK